MSLPAEAYEPVTDWDTLLTGVVTRGTTLRRRRRVLRGLPVVAALGGVIAIGVVLSPGNGQSSLRVVTDEPDKPPPVITTAAPNVAAPAIGSRPATPVTTTPAGAPRPTMPSTTAAPVAAPVARIAPGSRRTVLSYPDAQGDEQGAAAAGLGATPASSADIVSMRFSSTAAGLEVAMTLYGYATADAHYEAHLQDARTGCELLVTLDLGAGGVQPVCGGTAEASRHALPVDASGATLRVVLPWSMFPEDVPAHDSLTTSADTFVGASDRAVVDTASRPRSARFR